MNKIISYAVGLGAGIGTTFSFLPQVVHIFKNPTIEGLSPYMMMVHFSGVSLWIVYGFLKSDHIIIIFNGITLCLVSTIFVKYVQLKNATSKKNVVIEC